MPQLVAATDSPLDSASLAEAFCSFSETAVYLEQSYRDLQVDVRLLKEELVRANRKLADSLRETERIRALAEISAILAHEIRNPLASLELFTDLLGDAVAPGPSREWLEQIHAGIRLLSATVDNVLQFHGEIPLQFKQVNLAELLNSIVRFVQPVARQRKIFVEHSVTPGPCVIWADPIRLKQMFMNLSLNAFRAMREGQCLRIIAEPSRTQHNAWDLRFQDEGRGIPKENLDRIFEAGFSGDRQSTGLGLTVCRNTIEMHNGSITVESTENRGTTFVITLPIQRRIN